MDLLAKIVDRYQQERIAARNPYWGRDDAEGSQRMSYVKTVLGKDFQTIIPKGTEGQLAFYVAPWLNRRTGQSMFRLMEFRGKQKKPFDDRIYADEKSYRQAIDKSTVFVLKLINDKLQSQKKRREFESQLFIGDCFQTSWGYDQTNVEFYEIVKKTGPRSFIVREVEQELNEQKSDGYSSYVKPAYGEFIGGPIKILVNEDERTKIDGHYASPYEDGKWVYKSGPYGGH